eukprot:4871860-Pleurochrysis_carterae.AAC.1
MATFANAALSDHLRNFVEHAQHARIPFVIGAVDEEAFQMLEAASVAAYRTPLVSERYSLDGANSHASGSWKRFAGMRTGEVAKIVDLGYSVRSRSQCRNPLRGAASLGSSVRSCSGSEAFMQTMRHFLCGMRYALRCILSLFEDCPLCFDSTRCDVSHLVEDTARQIRPLTCG